MPRTKIESRTVSEVEPRDVKSISIFPVRDRDSGQGTGILDVVANYEIRDDAGAVVRSGTTTIDLDAEETTQLRAWISRVILPAANTKEGI